MGIGVPVVGIIVILPCVLLINSVLSFLLAAHIFAVTHTLVVAEYKDEYALNGEKHAGNSENEVTSCRKSLEKRRKHEHLQSKEYKVYPG